MLHDGVGGVRSQVGQAALRNQQRGQCWVDMVELPWAWRPRMGTVESAQVEGMDMVIRGVEFGVRGEVEAGVADEAAERWGGVDSGDFERGVGGEVELVVENGRGVIAAHEPEEAGVGAGAEGDDLLRSGGLGVQEFFDQEVDGAGADVGACRGVWGKHGMHWMAVKVGDDFFGFVLPRFMIGNRRGLSTAANSFANGSFRYPTRTALMRETLASTSVP